MEQKMEAIRDRRRRAALIRKQKYEDMLLNQLANTAHCRSTQNKEIIKKKNHEHEHEHASSCKTKRFRMQNAKGTSNMFIKP